jgi:hypothetical protein
VNTESEDAGVKGDAENGALALEGALKLLGSSGGGAQTG